MVETNQPNWSDYLRGGGVCCPYCGSVNIEGDSVGIDAGQSTQDITCLNCERNWSDYYSLHDVIDDEGNDHKIETPWICIIAGLPFDCYDGGIRFGRYDGNLTESEVENRVGGEMELLAENIGEDENPDDFWDPSKMNLEAYLQSQHDPRKISVLIFLDEGYGAK